MLIFRDLPSAFHVQWGHLHPRHLHLPAPTVLQDTFPPQHPAATVQAALQVPFLQSSNPPFVQAVLLDSIPPMHQQPLAFPARQEHFQVLQSPVPAQTVQWESTLHTPIPRPAVLVHQACFLHSLALQNAQTVLLGTIHQMVLAAAPLVPAESLLQTLDLPSALRVLLEATQQTLRHPPAVLTALQDSTLQARMEFLPALTARQDSILSHLGQLDA